VEKAYPKKDTAKNRHAPTQQKTGIPQWGEKLKGDSERRKRRELRQSDRRRSKESAHRGMQHHVSDRADSVEAIETRNKSSRLCSHLAEKKDLKKEE